MENHQDNLWSLSAQKYFWLEEPEIIKKILNGFLPGRANKHRWHGLRLRNDTYKEHWIFNSSQRNHKLRSHNSKYSLFLFLATTKNLSIQKD